MISELNLTPEQTEKVTAYRLSFRKILASEQLSKFLVHRAHGHFAPHDKGGYHSYRGQALE